jgi:hypothetical protein
MPGGEAGISKQEKIGLVMLVVATIGAGYLAWALFVAPGAAASEGALSGMRDNVAKLFAVLLLGATAIQKYGNGPLEDERDRQIKAEGMEAGYFALILMLFVSGMLIRGTGFADYLRLRPHGWLELYLLLCVAVSVAVSGAVRTYRYWCDRRAAR